MPSLELHGENVAPNAKAIAMAPTRVIWRQGRVGSRRSTCEDDREGQFHTQAFERYQRYEPHIAEGLTQMFVAGVSTQKVGEVAETLMGVAPSASTISRLNQSLTHQYETWRQRPLQTHWRVLYLEGNKEVLARRSCAEESKEGWLSLLQDVRTRGATQIDLIVTDGHDGLLGAVAELFAATPRQRSLVHKQRNVLAAIPRRERGDVQAELVGIWEQATKPEALIQLAAFKAKYAVRYPEAVRSLAEDEEHLFTFYAFPQTMYRHIQTTNAIESLFSNVRQRTDQIDVLYFGDQLPDHCLGDHSGYPLAQNLAVERLGTESTQSSQQPAREGGSRGGGFCASRDPLTST